MASEPYNPLEHSVVQASFGTWCEFGADDFVEALLMAILKEIKRVHWNIYQHEWGPTWHADEIEDPEIPGIVFTRYYDGCPCEDEPEHRPECRHARPNFQFEDVQFRWYKYPGRGMSTNKNWTPDEWRAWFLRCLIAVRSFDVSVVDDSDQRRVDRLQKSMQERFPKAFQRKVSDKDAAFYGALFDSFDRVEGAQTPCWVCSEVGLGAGGGMFEGGSGGMVARTLHENDNPEGPCVNCGHVNTEEQAAALDERRRKNSDESRARIEKERAREARYEARRQAICDRALAKLTKVERKALGV